MSQEKKQTAPSPGRKAAEFFVRIFHPWTYPVLAFLIIYAELFQDGIMLFALFRPLIMVAIARNVYQRLRKKPPFKLNSKKQFLMYARAAEPASLTIAALIWLLISQFVFRSWASDFFLEVVLFPSLLAMGFRIFWNISLHHISLGALTTLAYFSSLNTTYFWLPMLLLTVSLYMGWALLQLNRNSILQSGAGFLAGVAVILFYQMVYVPFVWDPIVVSP